MENKINSERFVKDLLDEYVERGFGTLAKRDLEVFLFHLLHKHGYFGKKLDFFQMSKVLRISEVKVRNLYQDVQLRYSMYTEDAAKEKFVQLLERGRFDVVPNRGYRLQIRDPLLRQFVEEWVDSVNGISDSSFSPTIIIIPREVFLDMLEEISPYKKLQDVRDKMPVEIDAVVTNEKTKRNLFSKFLDKYVDTLGEAAAKGTISMAGMGLRALLGILF